MNEVLHNLYYSLTYYFCYPLYRNIIFVYNSEYDKFNKKNYKIIFVTYCVVSLESMIDYLFYFCLILLWILMVNISSFTN